MESSNEELRELTLLENIENDPDVNQSTLATQLGVAVGTVNWHLKAADRQRLCQSQAGGAQEIALYNHARRHCLTRPPGCGLCGAVIFALSKNPSACE